MENMYSNPNQNNPSTGGDPNAITPKSEFLRVYFPTLPRTGQLHVRKLWEACTKRVTETANVGVGLQLNSRTVRRAPYILRDM